MATADYGSSSQNVRIFPASLSESHHWAGFGNRAPAYVPMPFRAPKWIPHHDSSYKASWVPFAPSPSPMSGYEANQHITYGISRSGAGISRSGAAYNPYSPVPSEIMTDSSHDDGSYEDSYGDGGMYSDSDGGMQNYDDGGMHSYDDGGMHSYDDGGMQSYGSSGMSNYGDEGSMDSYGDEMMRTYGNVEEDTYDDEVVYKHGSRMQSYGDGMMQLMGSGMMQPYGNGMMQSMGSGMMQSHGGYGMPRGIGSHQGGGYGSDGFSLGGSSGFVPAVSGSQPSLQVQNSYSAPSGHVPASNYGGGFESSSIHVGSPSPGAAAPSSLGMIYPGLDEGEVLLHGNEDMGSYSSSSVVNIPLSSNSLDASAVVGSSYSH